MNRSLDLLLKILERYSIMNLCFNIQKEGVIWTTRPDYAI